jgi:hypothetical protein
MRETPYGAASVRLVRMIWFSLLMSIVFYGSIVFMSVTPPVPESAAAGSALEAALSDPVIVALHLAGLVIFASAFPLSSSLFRRGASDSPVASFTGSTALEVAPRARLALILRWALFESAAVLGLIAALLAADPRLFLPLGGLAAAGFLLSFPSDPFLRRFMSPLPA